MKNTAITVLFIACLLAAAGAHAQTVRHVWTNSPFPGAPFNAWTNAARDIQAAIDAANAAAGDWVWVTNGVYDTGGRLEVGLTTTNRVVIAKPITVRSVNGPSNTFIVGKWDPGGDAWGRGRAAIRCVAMMTNAALLGFTLTNAASNLENGGCVFARAGAIISNCVVIKNSGYHGGGIYGSCYIYDSVFRLNYGRGGGAAAYGPTLINCLVEDNIAENWGGGLEYCVIYNCTVRGNTAPYGGGIYAMQAYNSVITGNTASNRGGGASDSYQDVALYNCLIYGNTAVNEGGGAHGLILVNCTVADNQVTTAGANRGGGTFRGTNINNIVFFNTAGGAVNNHYQTYTENSCTTPLPAGIYDLGGNITADPMFVDRPAGNYRLWGEFRLHRGSPCLDKGLDFPWMSDPADARGKDIEGGPRIRHKSVDMGAYELRVPRGGLFSAE